MGPFELMDLIGLDVSHPVMEIVSSGFYADPRLRPSVESAGRFAGGLLGRKTGEDFYRYRDDDAPDMQPETRTAAADAIPVFVHDKDAFAKLLRTSGVHVIDAPSETSVAVIFPVGEPAYRAALAAGVDPARTVGIDPLSIDGKRLTVVAPAALDRAGQRNRSIGHSFQHDGRPCRKGGPISPRVHRRYRPRTTDPAGHPAQ